MPAVLLGSEREGSLCSLEPLPPNQAGVLSQPLGHSSAAHCRRCLPCRANQIDHSHDSLPDAEQPLLGNGHANGSPALNERPSSLGKGGHSPASDHGHKNPAQVRRDRPHHNQILAGGGQNAPDHRWCACASISNSTAPNLPPCRTSLLQSKERRLLMELAQQFQ